LTQSIIYYKIKVRNIPTTLNVASQHHFNEQSEMKNLLNPTADEAVIRDLNLKSVQARRRLLKLGHEMKIRLHYGASMSITEILNILYFRWLNIDPSTPNWPERDRFILSKGHAAPALYVALSLRGFFEDREFENFRRLGSSLQGHPDRNKTPGVDCTSGSLGQGFPVACGMALGAQMDNASYRVYALISDGECNEGSVWEAALIAGNLKLDNLVTLLDYNRKSSYGSMAGRNDIEPLVDKWLAFGWHVFECDGHDYVSLASALSCTQESQGKPSVIICNTIKGKGIPYAEANFTRSNFALTQEQYQEALLHLDSLEKKYSYEYSH
jgi:transketolase